MTTTRCHYVWKQSQCVNMYNYVHVCINSSSSLWSTRSTFRVLAFINISFQTLFALHFRTAAALHRKWREREREKTNKTKTQPYTSHITMSHKCMHAWYGMQKRRTNIIACEIERKRTNSAKEMETNEEKTPPKNWSNCSFCTIDEWAEIFAQFQHQTQKNSQIDSTIMDWSAKKSFDYMTYSVLLSPPSLSLSDVGLLQMQFVSVMSRNGIGWNEIPSKLLD